jgi:hypothetical protein
MYDRERDRITGRINIDSVSDHEAMGHDAAPRAGNDISGGNAMITKTGQEATELEIDERLIDTVYDIQRRKLRGDIDWTVCEREKAYIKGWYYGVRQAQLGFDTATAEEIYTTRFHLVEMAMNRAYRDHRD